MRPRHAEPPAKQSDVEFAVRSKRKTTERHESHFSRSLSIWVPLGNLLFTVDFLCRSVTRRPALPQPGVRTDRSRALWDAGAL